jgi:nitric oxide reductase subunit B
LWLFVLSAGAIGLFYGAGLNWGQHTHLSIVEYWRWWVVHLWVEGFFEVFATTVIAFFFMRLGLIKPALAAKAALLAATIFLAGGIIGTCHHLYFSGTPTVALAFGSVFSALEVVPLTMVAYGAIDDLRRGHLTIWAQRYKWPIYFFVGVAFWNMIGAGLFGFMINPPIALYFMRGLITTSLHGHAALFGVSWPRWLFNPVNILTWSRRARELEPLEVTGTPIGSILLHLRRRLHRKVAFCSARYAS